MPTRKTKQQTPDLSALPDEVREEVEKALEAAGQVETLQEKLTEATDLIEKQTAAIEVLQEQVESLSDEEDDDEDLKKALDTVPDVVKKALADADEAVKKAQAQAEAAENIAKAEQAVRLNGEFIAKSQTLTNLAIDHHSFGPVLKSIADKVTSDEWNTLWTVLSAADAQADAAEMMKEIGKAGNDDGSKSEFEKQIAQVMAEEKCDYADAVSKAAAKNPAGYTTYVNDVRKGA